MQKEEIIAWIDRILLDVMTSSPRSAPTVHKRILLRNWGNIRQLTQMSDSEKDSPITKGLSIGTTAPVGSRIVGTARYYGDDFLVVEYHEEDKVGEETIFVRNWQK